MNIPLFSALFGKKKQTTPSLPDTLILKRLKTVAKEEGYLLFENITLYHRSKQISIALMVFIPHCGIVLFEYKEWSYEELNKAQIERTSHAQTSQNSLAFENAKEFIKEKYFDLSMQEDIPIFTFAIFEQLTRQDYEMLPKKFHALLPQERLLFSDSFDEEIKQKLDTLRTLHHDDTLNVENTLPFILSQYTILDQNERLLFANEEQRAAIEAPLENVRTLYGKRLSGKSGILLQKALLYALQNPQKTVAILTPTPLSADILRQRLFKLIELASIVIDMENVTVSAYEQIEQKKGATFDAFFLDDAFLYATPLQIPKKSDIFEITQKEEDADLVLQKSFSAQSVTRNGDFTTLLQNLYHTFNAEPSKRILIVANEAYDQSFIEDIESFLGTNSCAVSQITTAEELLNTPICRSDFDTREILQSEHLFLYHPDEIDSEKFQCLASSATISATILTKKGN